ncbi:MULTISPECIES: hypothetical protein [unclassified Pseudoalteromonas]|uniref:hypothetical protein n=1 Tax=unclassified Pseudoalteromonas TaxID=194690 RepID=UPI002097DFA2|nr:hypothetical protein [Pseudoalteromonas sp. XMcav2-N]MCO7189471.1 hypothetical protein [Pseudoalteromonas sp. XMcav2-N]
MKLALNKKNIKQLTKDSKALNNEMTPQVAGGKLYNFLPPESEKTCYGNCLIES